MVGRPAQRDGQEEYRDDGSVFAVLVNGAKAKPARLPLGYRIAELIKWVVEEFELPQENRAGRTLQYYLIHQRTRQRLKNDRIIADYDIQDQDTISVSSDVESTQSSSFQPTNSPTSLVSRFPETEDGMWAEVIDSGVHDIVNVVRDGQVRKDEREKALISIDKILLIVFATALLGTLFFSFYLIAVDKVTPVSSILYPVISLIIGFMSGYFAGSGRTKK